MFNFGPAGTTSFDFSKTGAGNLSNWRTYNVAAVPEPEEYGMMLLGFGMVGYQIKRKQKQMAQAAI